ncbi:Proteasomal ubiquitin receptor ADRM1 isoform X1 [Aphelenchoides fujianensis]|nr:Proteasomal ubiquitin receptor ADRM1 isoform X1 [Aphelenchoides fujianensis]
MDQTQLMQLFNLMNGGNSDILPQLSLNTNRSGSPAPETPKTRKEPPTASTAAPSKFDTNMLSQIISGLPAGANKRSIQLSNVLTRSNVEEVVKANGELLTPHLPTTSDSEEIKHTIGNPQFQQAADFFSYALQSGQLGPALKHFPASRSHFVHFSKELTESFRDKTGNRQANQRRGGGGGDDRGGGQEAQGDDDQMDLD